MVTNGEFSSLRMSENTHPLHILHIKSEAWSKVSRISVKSLLAFLTPIGWIHIHNVVYCDLFRCILIVNPDGSITAQQPNQAISEDILRTVLKWRNDGIGVDDIIDRLRAQTVPSGHPIHPWIAG